MSAVPLDQGWGYGIVLGMGIGFSGLMILLSYVQARYTPFNPSNADEFTSASRSVKPGLVASGIVSAWTWAATLLQSSAQAYKNGVVGPWWYAAGATVQVFLFSMNAAKLKLNAPYCHTFLEVIKVRFGTTGHLIAGAYSLATNILVSSMLILGGSATVSSLTGIHVLAACFLIPTSVSIYVLIGGMRATLVADYIHTAVLISIILAFNFVVYATSDKIGSPGKMVDLLRAEAIAHPVKGNKHGSYLTFDSLHGGIFGILNIIGNFATVYLDQAYWQRAIASKGRSAVKAYMLGGAAWLPVPLGMATAMGLAAAALQSSLNPLLTPSEVSAGLPAPRAATALMGATGAQTMLVLLFLAVTSATSAELIAVSTVVTHDVYRTYIRPDATDKQLLYVGHISVVVTAICMGFLGLIFHYIGISMGWLYEFMGCLLGGAVVPVAMAIMSSKTNKWAFIISMPCGLAAGLIAWLVAARVLYGPLTVDTTGADYPMLAGNVAAIATGAVICLAGSLIWPANYDFYETRLIGVDTLSPIERQLEGLDKGSPSPSIQDEKATKDGAAAHTKPTDITAEILDHEEDERPALESAYKTARIIASVLFVILVILIPIPLLASGHIWGKTGFAAYVSIVIFWIFCSAGIVVLYPIYESRAALAQICRGILTDIRTGGKGAYKK